MAVKVIGLDASRGKWLAVALDDGRFVDARLARSAAALVAAWPDAAAVGVDIPIGLPETPVREADRAAREFLGERRACVFPTFPSSVLRAPTYEEAKALCMARRWARPSIQSYGMRHRIRLLMFKQDGRRSCCRLTAGVIGEGPLNWMTPPTVIEEDNGTIVVRKRAGRSEDRLEIRIAEILSEADHEMGEAAALEKDGVEHQLQAELAARPEVVEEGLTLVRRTSVDLFTNMPEQHHARICVPTRIARSSLTPPQKNRPPHQLAAADCRSICEGAIGSAG